MAEKRSTSAYADEKRNPALGFVFFLVFSFLITCVAGLVVVASNQSLAFAGVLPPPHPLRLAAATAVALVVVAGSGPVVGALIASVEAGGREELRGLFSRILRWRTGAVWYVLALLGPYLVALAALLLSIALEVRRPPTLFAAVVPVQVLAVVAGALAEEIGLRGYAVPVLQKRVGAFGAGLLLGVVWFAWRNWKLATPNGMEFLAPLSLVMIVTLFVSASILITWLYNSSGQSVPVAWMANTGLGLAMVTLRIGFVQYALMVAIFCIAAATVIIRYGPATLARR